MRELYLWLIGVIADSQRTIGIQILDIIVMRRSVMFALLVSLGGFSKLVFKSTTCRVDLMKFQAEIFHNYKGSG